MQADVFCLFHNCYKLFVQSMTILPNFWIQFWISHTTVSIQEGGNADPEIKAGFLYFPPKLSTQINVFLPFEGHNVAYQSKGVDQSNIVCEYEVNLSTNEKVINEKQNFNTNCC